MLQRALWLCLSTAAAHPRVTTASMTLTVITEAVLTSTGSSKSADGRTTEAWTALYGTHTGTVPFTQMGKRGLHLLWHSCVQCSLHSANPSSPTELCCLHQTHLLGKGASTKCLSWTCLNTSSAQDHQAPLPKLRYILYLNEALTLHALGGNTCDLLQTVKAKAQIPIRKQGIVGCEALWSQEHARCNVS